MDQENLEVSTITAYVPLNLKEKFRIKTLSEGYSLNMAVILLIKKYVEGTFDIKIEDRNG